MVSSGWAKALTLFSALLFLLYSNSGFGQNNTNSERSDPRRAFTLLEKTGQQQLPLNYDRFRIDYAVDQITLVIFRYPDTAPVVLTLPDGSKWYASRHPDNVDWYSAHDYDLIRMREPQPGPWQVAGRVRPESRIMVLSDIEFHPEPLPSLLFRGEKVKLTGRLTENGEPIQQRDFRSVIRLELFMISTNNPQYDNFGQAQVQVGEFLDDGRGMDERPRDGIFTGEITLDIAAGEYVPSFRARTPLHTRLFEAEPVLLRRLPVRPRVSVSQVEDAPHRIQFEVDEDYVRADDIVLSGRILYPNGETQRISISTAQGESLFVEVPSYTFGVFEMTLRLSATDVTGREFQLVMPTVEFRSQRPVDTGPTEQEQAAERLRVEQEAHEAQLRAVTESRDQQQNRVLWIILINIGIVAIWMFVMLLRGRSDSAGDAKARAAAKKAAKAQAKAEKAAKKEAKKAAKNAAESKANDKN